MFVFLLTNNWIKYKLYILNGLNSCLYHNMIVVYSYGFLLIVMKEPKPSAWVSLLISTFKK